MILQTELEAGHAPASLTRMERAILAKLRTMEPAAFASLPDVSEGLENRLYAAVRTADSLETLYQSVKTKRYPWQESAGWFSRLSWGSIVPMPQAFPRMYAYWE